MSTISAAQLLVPSYVASIAAPLLRRQSSSELSCFCDGSFAWRFRGDPDLHATLQAGAVLQAFHVQVPVLPSTSLAS